jgi:macrodomain Ter protein organizer (MatP/YcbG family)
VRQTQVQLEDEVWNNLEARAKREGTTIEDLARQAIRERYCSSGREERRRAMMAFVGIRADRDDIGDSTEYIRELREDDRLERLK